MSRACLRGAVLLALALASMPCLADDVVWHRAAGVLVDGNSLTKTGPPGWNAGALSTKAIVSGDGYAEFATNDLGTDKICGLARISEFPGYPGIDFAIRLGADGNIAIVESGVLKAAVGSYAIGDRFSLSIESGVVLYRQNGSLLYTSARTPFYPLIVDAALNQPEATVVDAVISGSLAEPVEWTNLGKASASLGSLSKTGTAYALDAGAVSTKGIASPNGYMEFTATDTSTYRMAGLSYGDSILRCTRTTAARCTCTNLE